MFNAFSDALTLGKYFALLLRAFSYLGITISSMEGYHHFYGGCSAFCRAIIRSVEDVQYYEGIPSVLLGDTTSTVEGFRCCGECPVLLGITSLQ